MTESMVGETNDTSFSSTNLSPPPSFTHKPDSADAINRSPAPSCPHTAPKGELEPISPTDPKDSAGLAPAEESSLHESPPCPKELPRSPVENEAVHPLSVSASPGPPLPSTPPRVRKTDGSDPYSPPSRFGTPSGSISMRRRTGPLPSPIQPSLRPHSHSGQQPYIRLSAHPHLSTHAYESVSVIRRADLTSDVVTPVTAQSGALARLAQWRETQQMVAAHMSIDRIPHDTEDDIIFDSRTGQLRSPHAPSPHIPDAHSSSAVQQLISDHRATGRPLDTLKSACGTQEQNQDSPGPQIVHNITYGNHPAASYGKIPPPPSISSTGGLLTPLDSAQQKTARPGAHQMMAEQQRQQQQAFRAEANSSGTPLTAPLTSGGAGLLTPLAEWNLKGSEMLRQQRAPQLVRSLSVLHTDEYTAPLPGTPGSSHSAHPDTRHARADRIISPPLRSAGLPSELREARRPPSNHAISPTVGTDGTIITIDLLTLSIPSPAPSTKSPAVPKRVREAWAEAVREGREPSLSHREFAMKKLVEWGQEYYFAPHTADLWILFPYTSKRGRPADSKSSFVQHPRAGAATRRLKRYGIWSKPLPDAVRKQITSEVKSQSSIPTSGAERMDTIAPYQLNILSYKRLIKVDREDARDPGQPFYDYYAVPVHMNYVTPFSLLISRILHAATGSQTDHPIPRDETGGVKWQSPVFNGAEMWSTPKDARRMMYLPIPDPRSFLLLLHWMYFQRDHDIHTCLSRRVASWEGMVENIEYLEMYAEARDLVQSWWDRWIAPSDTSSRYQAGFEHRRGRRHVGISRVRAHSTDRGLEKASRKKPRPLRSEDRDHDHEQDGGDMGDVGMDGSDPSDIGHEADDEGTGTGIDTQLVDRLADQVSSAFSNRD